MISKLMICPFFGDYPDWMPHWYDNTERMREHGYDFLFDDDEQAFRDRVEERLGIVCPPMRGTGRIWNFRPAFGQLYAREIEGFDFWGHTDFDCVYGRVENWVTDEFLNGLDIHSNHDDYICGPWTLYRNVPKVNNLFYATGEWRDRMSGEDWAHGWAEKGYSEIVDTFHDAGTIKRVYTKWQTRSQDNFDDLSLEADGALYDGWSEVMMAHFRRTKVYPAGAIL